MFIHVFEQFRVVGFFLIKLKFNCSRIYFKELLIYASHEGFDYFFPIFSMLFFSKSTF